MVYLHLKCWGQPTDFKNDFAENGCTYTENIRDNQRTFAVENAMFGCTNFIKRKKRITII